LSERGLSELKIKFHFNLGLVVLFSGCENLLKDVLVPGAAAGPSGIGSDYGKIIHIGVYWS
jgi:hypothetical protein